MHAILHTFLRRRVWLAGLGIALAAALGVWLTLNASFASAAASFSDNFESGLAAGWAKSGGTWSVVGDGSKVLSQSSATADLAREFNGDKGWTDYALTAKVKPVGLDAATDFVALAARATSNTTFYRLALFADRVELQAVRSGTVTVLGTTSRTFTAGTWYTLRLDTAGRALTGYVDGAKVASGTSSAIGSGRIGLQTYQTAAEFDDVTVTATGAPTSSGSVATATVPGASPTGTTAAPKTPTATTPAPSTTTSGSRPAWPTATGTVPVTATITVSGTYDGKMRRFAATGLGDGGQGESQQPVFDLPNGGVLENVIIGAPGVDGIHCEGTCTLKNVWWEDVGEDAATFKSKSPTATMTIDGGGAKGADDKVFQHNGAGTVVIQNFQVDNFGKLYRSCGNCSTQFERHVVVKNVWAVFPGKTLVGINANYGDTATFSGVTVIGDSGKKLVICTRFQGNDTGAEPTKLGTGPDGTSCRYSDPDITYRAS